MQLSYGRAALFPHVGSEDTTLAGSSLNRGARDCHRVSHASHCRPRMLQSPEATIRPGPLSLA